MSPASPRSGSEWTSRLLAITLMAVIAPFSLAQLSLHGEIGFGADFAASSTAGDVSDTFSASYRLHLEASYALDPISLNLILDPAARAPDNSPIKSLVEVGLTEVYILWRGDSVDVSVGIERLPLEAARLNIPYSIEPRASTGLPRGLPGARASLFVGPWRVRSAIIYRAPHPGLVASVRHNFSSFELEVHTLYLDSFAAGLSGSGLVGPLVLYGEAWLLTSPFDGRGALGLSGSLDNALWTLEAAYSPPLVAPEAAPLPQVAGQLNLPVGDAWSLDINGSVSLVDSALNPGSSTLQGLMIVTFNLSSPNYTLSFGPSLAHTELATNYGIGVELKGFF